jgi:hypothetical protein
LDRFCRTLEKCLATAGETEAGAAASTGKWLQIRPQSEFEANARIDTGIDELTGCSSIPLLMRLPENLQPIPLRRRSRSSFNSLGVEAVFGGGKTPWRNSRSRSANPICRKRRIVDRPHTHSRLASEPARCGVCPYVPVDARTPGTVGHGPLLPPNSTEGEINAELR